MKTKTSIRLASALCALAAAGTAAAEVVVLDSSYVPRHSIPVYTPGQTGSVRAGPSNTHSRSDSSAYATTSSQGGSAQGVGSQGQSLSMDNHAIYEAQARNPVSTAIAPALTSSNDTCMGSSSVGASAVSFGLSFGSTWTDNNCLMLKNSREMWNMGFKGAALARMCMDDLNREALEATGISCPTGRRGARSGLAGANNTESGYRN
jgi:hypothetical protein